MQVTLRCHTSNNTTTAKAIQVLKESRESGMHTNPSGNTLIPSWAKVYRSETEHEELLCPSWCVVWQMVQSGSTDLLRNRCTCLPFGSCEHILHDCFLHHQKVLVLPIYFLIQFPKSTECHLQSMTPKQIRDKQLVPYINMFVINVFYSSSETLSKLFLHLAVTYNKLFPFYLEWAIFFLVLH